MNAIETKGLCKRYGNKNVVNNLYIQVPQGVVYGFIGRNGAGKSTTQKMVCGLINASVGDIRLFGKEVDDPKKEQWKRLRRLVLNLGIGVVIMATPII